MFVQKQDGKKKEMQERKGKCKERFCFSSEIFFEVNAAFMFCSESNKTNNRTMNTFHNNLTTSSGKMLLAVLFFLLPTVLFTGCLKDKCEQTSAYKYFKPVYLSLSDLRKAVKTTAASDLKDVGKVYYKDQFIYVNEINKGIHVIDNHNPSAPQNIAFINIPGNVDMAVKGNILYADSYIDLVAIDITNPVSVTEVNRVTEVFPERIYVNGYMGNATLGVITDWIERDTIVTQDCNTYNGPMFYENAIDGGGIYMTMDATSSSSSATTTTTTSPGTGIAGSMARFCIYQNFLYTLDQWSMKLFDITNTSNPIAGTTINMSWNIETIFPYLDKLFIGSTNGVFIYDNSNPTSPTQLAQFVHATSCDPVVVSGNYAYSTLRSGTSCNGFSNQLDVIDITNISSPVLKVSYQMTNPHGLGIDGTTLFICDNTAGLKVYDATDPLNISLKQTVTGMVPYDVIPINNDLIMVAEDGLYQYDYSNTSNLQLLSKVTIVKN